MENTVSEVSLTNENTLSFVINRQARSMEGLPSIAAFTGKIERPTGQRQLLKKREGSNQAPGSNTSKF